MKKLEKFLQKYNVIKNEFIVVATSGGPDSMFLLDSLNNQGYKVICAHVNHNVRMESKEEYKFVENYCLIHNIIFEGMKIEEYHNDNFHNDARNIRYKFFQEVIKKYNAKYLATAHHGDDLIETILMKITRGSNISGYKGFSFYEKFNDYILIRPLIEYTKDEIRKKCLDNNIKYVTDLSNEADKYTRNRFRHHILSFLKQENKNVHEKYLEFSNELNEISEFIDEISTKLLPNIYQNKEIDLTELKKQPNIIKKRILELLLSEIYLNDINKISKSHIHLILDAISNQKPQITLKLPNSIYAVKIYNKLLFKNKIEKLEEYECILEKKLVLPNGHTLEMLNTDINDTSNYTIRLNSKHLTLPLIVRTRKPGDKMIVKNMENSKKIKEIFIENKIPSPERNSWPIVLDKTGQIIWLPGLKKSNFDIKKGNKYDIIIKYS